MPHAALAGLRGAPTEAREQRARLQMRERQPRGDKDRSGRTRTAGEGVRPARSPTGPFVQAPAMAEVLQARRANGFAGLESKLVPGLMSQWNAEDDVEGVGEEVDSARIRAAACRNALMHWLDLGITQAGHRHFVRPPLRVGEAWQESSSGLAGYRHCNGGNHDIPGRADVGPPEPLPSAARNRAPHVPAVPEKNRAGHWRGGRLARRGQVLRRHADRLLGAHGLDKERADTRRQLRGHDLQEVPARAARQRGFAGGGAEVRQRRTRL